MNVNTYTQSEVLNGVYNEDRKHLIVDDGLDTEDYYTLSKTFSVAQNGYIRVLLKTNNEAVKFVINLTSELKCRYKSYMQTTITANGTELPTFCREIDIPTTHTFKIYQTPTYTGGTLRADDFVGANTPQVRLGGSVIGGVDSRIPKNSHLIMEIQNVGNSTSDINLVINYVLD
jgi:hypothetical protein